MARLRKHEGAAARARHERAELSRRRRDRTETDMKPDIFVHEHALCESTSIGRGTRIWAFAHVLPGARIGEDCNICDGVFVENDVRIGESIGANATILPGIEIGAGAMVGAGTVVTRTVPPNAIALGNPARITGYVDAVRGSPHPVARASAETGAAKPVGVGEAALHELPFIEDMRGNLTVGEFERSVPFVPKRYFLVLDVPSREVRGEHAHRTCLQFLVCIRGSCALVIDDGRHRAEVLLDRPNLGLFLPSMIWGIQYKYSPDANTSSTASGEYLYWMPQIIEGRNR